MSNKARYLVIGVLSALGLLFAYLTVQAAAYGSNRSDPLLTQPRFPKQSKAEILNSLNLVSDTVSSDLESQLTLHMEATPVKTTTLATWWNIRPTENYLRDVSMLPPTYNIDCGTKVGQSPKSKGWIVGDDGLILGYCNGFWSNFIPVESVPTDLFAVQALEPSLAVAVGESGTILEYKFDPIVNADAWTKYPIPVANQAFYDVSMVPDGDGGYTGWAVGIKDGNGYGILAQGRIPHLPNTPWQNRTGDFPGLPLVDYYYDVQTISPTDAWAVGGLTNSYGVIIHWDGNQWALDQKIGTDIIHAIYMRAPNEGWAVGRNGKIYKYNGTDWSIYQSPTNNRLMDIKFDQEGIGWAIGDKGAILKYHNLQWELITDIRSDPWWNIALDFTSGHGWMVALGDVKTIGGQILEYSDGLWLPFTVPTDNRLNDVAVVDENDVWAVGQNDSLGGTIVHWDGLHWQRWYQKDLPIPAANLYAVDMVSPTLGWAAGGALVTGGPAVFLRWDGVRWAQPRAVSPVNVRVSDLSILDQDVDPNLRAWAAPESGNAVPRWDGVNDYWTAISTCNGTYYAMRSVSVIPSSISPTGFNWDAWAVGRDSTLGTEHILRFSNNCPDGNRWQKEVALLGGAFLIHLDLLPYNAGGFAVGQLSNRAVIYEYKNQVWSKIAENIVPPNGTSPSIFRRTDIVEDSQIGWFGGHYFDTIYQRLTGFVYYRDDSGLTWAGNPFPYPNSYSDVYHRPILGLEMASDTLGWVVGEGSDSRNLSVFYHYPFPNYTVNVNPASQAVAPGGMATYSITVNSRNEIGPDAPYQLVNSYPGLINASIISDTITLETTLATPPGKYNFELISTSLIWSLNKFIPVTRTDTFQLIVTPVLVTSINPIQARAGQEVVITGLSFGSDPGPGNRSTPSHHVVLAGRQMPEASVISWSENEIRVVVPDNPGLFPLGPDWGPVSVTADSIISNDQLTFQLENYLSGVSNHVSGSYLLVTVYGTSLGNDPGSSNRSTQYEHVTFNGAQIANADVLSWSNNSITFRVPVASTSGPITVTSNGYQSNPVDLSEGWVEVYLPQVIQ